MISIKDYAKESGVSYEAVRQRVKRYEAELTGHIHKQGRVQYLDDIAVAFLNDHRLKEPTVLYDRAAGEEFRELKAELAEAKAQAADFWDQLKKKEATMALMVQQNEDYRLKAAAADRLQATNDSQAAQIAKLEAGKDKAEEEASKAIQEAKELNEKLQEEENRRKAAEAKLAEFESLPFWKKPFWKG